MTSALPAVDVKDFSGDERGAVQIQNSADDVVDFAHVADRVQATQCGVGICAMHWRLYNAGRDGIDPDPALGVFDSEELVAAFMPPLVSEASTDGTPSMA